MAGPITGHSASLFHHWSKNRCAKGKFVLAFGHVQAFSDRLLVVSVPRLGTNLGICALNQFYGYVAGYKITITGVADVSPLISRSTFLGKANRLLPTPER
jgi:hypothetical protein